MLSGTYCQNLYALKSPVLASSRNSSAVHRPAVSILCAMSMAVIPSGKVRRTLSVLPSISRFASRRAVPAASTSSTRMTSRIFSAPPFLRGFV